MYGITLFVLDVQRDFTDLEARFPVAKNQVKPMIENTNKIISNMNHEKMHIIYIGNEFERNQFISNWFRNHASLKGSPGAQLNVQLRIVNNNYFAKNQGDAFSNSSLVDYIQDNNIKNIFIAGLFAEGCVTATAKGAKKRGLSVFVLEDAVAGANDRKRDMALRNLSLMGVTLIQTEDLLIRNA
ncbi:cysteine hydrolase [Bacillus sp. JJ1122]|uniref:cysteine hydrolase n=1 Tax=Bacillus sp. JJ1122 TaxID=3122951 RepID=UPI003000894A